MPVPSLQDFNNISNRFFKDRGFPNCVGALDVKDFRIKQPAHSGSKYYNFKKFYSVVWQAVVGADYKFIFIEVGRMGKHHDSFIFHTSSLYKALTSNMISIPQPLKLPGSNITVPFVLLADGAYPLLNFLMKPYRGNHLLTEEKIFNQRLSRARTVVESTFGQLAKRFEIFHRLMEQSPETTSIIIKSACLLHNLIIDSSVSSRWFSKTMIQTVQSTLKQSTIAHF